MFNTSRILLLIVIACGYFCAYGFWSVSADELSILAVEEPPSSFINSQGEPAGFSVDVVRELQHRLNNNDPIQFVPEIRGLDIASKSPNVILFSFSKTPERENDFHWIMLLMRKPWVMYSQKGAGFSIETIEEARKIESIGVVRGDVRALYLERMGFSNLRKVKTHDQNLKKLLSNRIQMLFYDPQGMSYTCSKLGIAMSEFEPVLETKPSEVYVMMSRQGTDPETVRQWRDTARQMKADGTFQNIAEKWVGIIYEQNGIICEVKDGALNF